MIPSADVAAARRFWVEFAVDPGTPLPRGCREGVGVTAADEGAGLALIQQMLFRGGELPPIRRILPDVDAMELCPWLVLPNMTDWDRPGIWFPCVPGAAGG